MAQVKQLFRQTSGYFLGLVGGKLFGTIVFILYARALRPEKFGHFILFLTLIQIITYLGDFGLVQWYQKKARSGNKIEKNKLFSRMISARASSLLASLPLGYLFAAIAFSFSPTIVIMFIFSLVPEAFLSVLDGYYLECRQSFRVALKAISRTAVLFVGYFPLSGFSLRVAILFYFLASLLTLVWYFPFTRLRNFSFSGPPEILRTLRSSARYALLMITSFAYSKGDSLIVRYTLDSAALGLYGAAYRYLEALSLAPTALFHNLFPLAAQDKQVSWRNLLRITVAMAAIGGAAGFVVFLFSDFLIITILGNAYAQAAPVLRIFSPVLALFFLNAPLSSVVQSSGLLPEFLPYGLLNTIINLLLNLAFVPVIGVTAAAWAMLFTEMTGFVINVAFVRKIYLT